MRHDSDRLLNAAMKHVQSDEVATHLADLILGELEKVEGFNDLPKPMQEAVAKRAAELYGTGFVQGARWVHWRL